MVKGHSFSEEYGLPVSVQADCFSRGCCCCLLLAPVCLPKVWAGESQRQILAYMRSSALS